MDSWIKSHIIKIEPGQVREFSQAAGAVQCYKATAEVQISIDGESWAPFDRGIKIPLSFKRLFFRSSSASTETLTIVTANNPEAFQDNRELAAQISVDGGIVTNTAPLSQQGGAIMQVGDSSYSNYFNQPVAVTDDLIINAATNANGVYVKWLFVDIRTSPSTNGSTGFFFGNGLQFRAYRGAVGIYEDLKETYLAPGTSLTLRVGAGVEVSARANYQIL